jgi:hypothetical protein
MNYEFLSVDEMVAAVSETLSFVCRGITNTVDGQTLRFYDRELVVIGRQKAIAKRVFYVPDKIKSNVSRMRRVGIGEEYDRDVKCWVKVIPNQEIYSAGYMDVSTTKSLNFGYYTKTTKTDHVGIGIWSASYGIQKDQLKMALSEFIGRLSKNKRKALSRAIVKYQDRLELFKMLCKIFRITVPVEVGQKRVEMSFYGVEPIPTKDEERDRIISELISSKRIIE